MPLDVIDLVLLQEKSNACVELVGHASTPPDRLLEIERGLLE